MFRVFSILLWLAAAYFVVRQLPSALSAGAFTGERLATTAILLLLAWSLVELLVRASRAQAEHTAVAGFQELFAQTQRSGHTPRPYNHHGPRAAQRAAQMAECARADISKLHETVPAIAALDATTLAANYGPLNVYAWVLPVLGFMGTALGMAEAIRGFKDALGRTRGDLNVLVQALGDSVIPALAGAFHVTILALGASLVVYLCTSALRDWDQEALHKVDRLCIVMLANIPLPEGPASGRIVQAIEHISTQIADILRAPATLDEAGKAIAAASERLLVAARELEASATAPYVVTVERGKPAQPTARVDGAVRPL